MTLTIELEPEVEAGLRVEATKAGLDAKTLASLMLKEGLQKRVQRKEQLPPRLSKRESELMLQVNETLPEEAQKEYRKLRRRFRAETLTESEHRRLIEISDEMERLNAHRIRCVAELARLKQVSLEEMLKRLGIQTGRIE